ncbi:NAD(P)-binding protein [Aspergillus heterothallicus]
MSERQVIVLAGGSGDLGRYIHEELVKNPRYSVALLTRNASPNPSSLPHTTIHPTDYTLPSILSILTQTRATALISTIRCPDNEYLPIHQALLDACLASAHCKRFIPSEWAGDIENFPDIPPFYGKTRAPFREILNGIPPDELQWTLFCHGWFMEYFLAPEKSYMRCIPGEFPVDLVKGVYTVRGTGEEMQSFTAGRDVGTAVAVLLGVAEWEPITYVTGEWSSFNDAVARFEKFYGRTLTRTHRSLEDIQKSLEEFEKDPSCDPLGICEIEQWQASGATSCPKEKTLRQYQKYFSGMNFVKLEEMLKMGE